MLSAAVRFPDVEGPDLASEAEVRGPGVALSPDAVEGLSLPEGLGEGRAVVGRVGLGAHDDDGTLGVDLPDPVDGRVCRHATTDDQVLCRGHGVLRFSRQASVRCGALSMSEELLPGGLLLEGPANGARGRGRSGLGDPSHLHAEVPGLDDDHRPFWTQALLDERGDLHCHPLLDLRATSVELDDPRQLREADDPVLRHVGDVGPAEEGQQVVRADRVERDVGHRDHPLVALGVRERAQLGGPPGAKAREQLAEGPRHAALGPLEVRVLHVEAQALERRPEVRGGPLERELAQP